MEIIVLGAGAIGSLYGAKLAAAEQRDLDRPRQNMSPRSIRTDCALKASSPQSSPIRAATAIEKIGPDAMILLTTKVTDGAAALAPIASLVREDTTILCLQNGLGSERIARDRARRPWDRSSRD